MARRAMIGTNRAYTAGHFELAIDGRTTTAYLKTIDGGFVKANVIEEPVGPSNERIKHTSTVDIDPLSIEFGLSGAQDVLKWIQDSWKREFTRCSGQVTHADFDYNSTFEHEFMNALITETTFPSLDGSSKEAAYLKIKLQPEHVKSRPVPSGGGKLKGSGGVKQKMWLPSSFRLNIDGIRCAQHVNKIESFTIKQGIKKQYIGTERYPQIEPTKIDFPNLSCTIALAFADELLKWYDSAIVKGVEDSTAQKTGSIEFLSPDRKTVLFEVKLFEMGLASLQVMQSTANSDQIKRVKFELYVGRMELVFDRGMG